MVRILRGKFEDFEDWNELRTPFPDNYLGARAGYLVGFLDTYVGDAYDMDFGGGCGTLPSEDWNLITVM
jgi:hypothetical protein